ncbi:MAG: methyltransferase domain-containing protein [Planctomycetota bacterium]
MRRVPFASIALLALGACEAPRQEVRTPVPETINDSFLGDDVDVDRFVGRWELESREVYAGRDDIVAALGIEPGETVADVGVGTGLFLEPLADAVGASGRLYAVDISPAFVFHVRERAREAGLDHVEVVLSTQRSAELPANSIDAVLLCDVYHHFEYHEDMLRSILRALKPGGRFVVVDFHRIPGVTREWLLGHVRAGQEVFVGEIVEAGFRKVDEIDVPAFEENYLVRFVKDGPQSRE